MACSRPPAVVAILTIFGMLVIPSACANSTRPVAVPAPPPAIAPAVPPAAPAPAVPQAQPEAAAAPRPPAPVPLLGYVTRDEVRAYAPWQPLFVEPYVPDPAATGAIKAGADGLTVFVIIATWCPDSKRELPRFFAIMDGAGIRDSQLTMVGVDRTKKDAEGLTEKWGITRVPTFVFLRNGQEMGRVVEKVPAGTTLEGEIARLLAAKL